MSFIPVYLFILGGTIVIDYIAGILIEKSSGAKRKSFLVLSLIANIGVLAVFKYYNFIAENINLLSSAAFNSRALDSWKIILPIGLSFHTFQAMSYTIEVYRGNQKAEKNFGIYALYVMFYPQLVAGPIERPQNLIHQFYEEHNFDIERFKSGITLMMIGFFKKVVIADRLSMAVDYSYSNLNQQSGLSVAIATFFYCFQIYCDFSGYSDIAIGAARIMGFDLMKNFNAPYFSKSISEFWTRWHISLSTWFKDYLYIPLGGNRVTISRKFINLFIVFALSGLWHGANYTFIIWGILHALLLGYSNLKTHFTNKFGIEFTINKFTNTLSTITTFVAVWLTWIFFRSPSLTEAKVVFGKLFTLGVNNSVDLFLNKTEIIFCFFLIALLGIYDYYIKEIKTSNTNKIIALNVVLIAICYFFGVFNHKQFIYFQF
jgi:alginate O-acetyltransferase complex protein AlgI